MCPAFKSRVSHAISGLKITRQNFYDEIHTGVGTCASGGKLKLEMSFERNARAALLYFDLFDFPLTEEELYSFLPVKEHKEEFTLKLRKAGLRSSDGLYHLREGHEIASLRKTQQARAAKMLAAARFMGNLIRHFPFVRGVYLSGSLSKGVDSGDADIDFFIITAESRLWICRAILTMFKKIFFLNSKKFLCLNYFLSENHLEIPEKNVFTATELVTLQPLHNEELLRKLLAANEWIYNFYPNFKLKWETKRLRRSFVQKVFELPLSDGYTEKLDNKLMKYYRKLWAKRYRQFVREKREFLFRSTPYSSKVHPKDYQSIVLDAYEERLKTENLERLTRLDG